MTPPIRTETLANGLRLEFHDEGNRYFGDYHRLRLVARCRIPLTSGHFAGLTPEELAQARQRLGEALEYRRDLEQMAVPGAEVAPARERIIDRFLETAGPYLSRADFARRLLESELARRGRGPAWAR